MNKMLAFAAAFVLSQAPQSRSPKAEAEAGEVEQGAHRAGQRVRQVGQLERAQLLAQALGRREGQQTQVQAVRPAARQAPLRCPQIRIRPQIQVQL
jgi:hypothetical protein